MPFATGNQLRRLYTIHTMPQKWRAVVGGMPDEQFSVPTMYMTGPDITNVWVGGVDGLFGTLVPGDSAIPVMGRAWRPSDVGWSVEHQEVIFNSMGEEKVTDVVLAEVWWVNKDLGRFSMRLRGYALFLALDLDGKDGPMYLRIENSILHWREP